MSRKTLPLIGAMLAALAAIGLAAIVAWHQIAGGGTGLSSNAGKGEAIIAPGISIGGPFNLIGPGGKPVTDKDFAGKFMLVYFGYTFCPDVCPTELATIAAALDQVAEKNPAEAKAIAPIFITIDPERDTPAVVSDYAKAFHPQLVGLSGPLQEIDKVAKEYRVFYGKGDDIGDGYYLMNHSSYIYLIGPDGKFVTMFHGGTTSDVIAEALLRYGAAQPTS